MFAGEGLEAVGRDADADREALSGWAGVAGGGQWMGSAESG